jgi:hypothetical protein
LTLNSQSTLEKLKKSTVLSRLISSIDYSSASWSPPHHILFPLYSRSVIDSNLASPFPFLLTNEEFETQYLGVTTSHPPLRSIGKYAIERKLYRAKQIDAPFSLNCPLPLEEQTSLRSDITVSDLDSESHFPHQLDHRPSLMYGNPGDWVLTRSSSSSLESQVHQSILTSIEFYQEFEILRQHYLTPLETFSSSGFQGPNNTSFATNPTLPTKSELISSYLHIIQMPSTFNYDSSVTDETDLAKYVHHHNSLMNLLSSSHKPTFHAESIPLRKFPTQPTESLKERRRKSMPTEFAIKEISPLTPEKSDLESSKLNKSKRGPHSKLSQVIRDQFFPQLTNTSSHSPPSTTCLSYSDVYHGDEVCEYTKYIQPRVPNDSPIITTPPRRKSLSSIHSTVVSCDAEHVIWSGFLEKKGGKGLKSSWKKRWFVLDGNCLASGFRYFETSSHDDNSLPFPSPPSSLKWIPSSHLHPTPEAEAEPVSQSNSRVSDLSNSSSQLVIETMRSSSDHLKSPLGAIPLLCCVISTNYSSSGELVMTLQQQLIDQSVSINSKYSISTSSLSSPSSWKRTGSSSVIKRQSSLQPESPRWSQLSTDTRAAVTTFSFLPKDQLSPNKHTSQYRKSMFRRTSTSTSFSPTAKASTLGLNSDDSSSSPTPTLPISSSLSFNFANLVGADVAMGFENLYSRTFYLRFNENEDSNQLQKLLSETSYVVTLSTFHSACSYATHSLSHTQSHSQSHSQSDSDMQTQMQTSGKSSLFKKKKRRKQKTTEHILESKFRIFILVRNCFFYLLCREKGDLKFLFHSSQTSQRSQRSWNMKPFERQSLNESTEKSEERIQNQSSDQRFPIHAACQSLNSSILQVLLPSTLLISHSHSLSPPLSLSPLTHTHIG